MKKKLKNIVIVLAYLYAIIVCIVGGWYILSTIGDDGCDTMTYVAKGCAWIALGILIIYGNYSRLQREDTDKNTQRLYFNQWVEYDSYDAWKEARNGCTSERAGCVIQHEDHIIIYYEDKFGSHTIVGMAGFGDYTDKPIHYYANGKTIAFFPHSRLLAINDACIRLNYNQTLLS